MNIKLLSILVLFIASAGSVSAQSPQFTLLPNQLSEFRFEYLGDGSFITVAFDSPGATNVNLSIYTPAQLDARARGENPNPVGRGAPQRNHELFWTGSFNQGGVYRVILENKSNAVYTYHLDIGGGAVKSAAPMMTPTPQPTSDVSFDGKQRILTAPLPPGAGSQSIRLAIPTVPSTCTHVNQIPQLIKQSVRLCANEVYPPLKILGNNIVLFGDESHISVITSSGRQFALTVDGSNNWIENVTIQANADKLDKIAWLCIYPTCTAVPPSTAPIPGGMTYGGGVLLNGSNSVIRSVTVRNGMIGIATNSGRRNYILENQLSDVNGWGSYNVGSTESYFIGNEWSRVNHGCVGSDGRKYDYGCETSGWVCLACNQNIIAHNQCTGSANCYYMNGDHPEMRSNNNKFVSNYCAAATNNCFELTFSLGNVLQDNVSTVDPKSGRACQYPYWVGGSAVYFKNNRWECDIDATKAYDEARAQTAGTQIYSLESYIAPTTIPASASSQNPTSLPTRAAPTLTPVPPTRLAPTSTPSLTRPRDSCVPNQIEKKWDTRFDALVMPTC